MNKQNKNTFKGVLYGFLGAVICMMLLGTRKPDMEVETGVDIETGEPVLLLNTRQTQRVPIPPVTGRYQISSWGVSHKSGGGYGAFVTDTATGRTKIAYTHIMIGNGKEVRINNLGTSFDNIP